MATVTGLSKERMLEIEAASVVDGSVNGSGHLILTKHDASTIDAGSVIGPKGDNATALLTVQDTNTVDLTKNGSGTVADPWVLKADLVNPTKLMQLAPNYVGPGPAYVTDVGTGLGTLYGPYEWAGQFDPCGNPVVRLQNIGGTYFITGHASGYSKGGWRSLTYGSSFHTYSQVSANSPFEPFSDLTKCVLTPAGIVLLQGLYRARVAVTGGTSGAVIATLPSDMRPDTSMTFPVNISDTVGYVTIFTDGRVMVQSNMTAGMYISLTNVAFPAAGVATWTNVATFYNSYADYGDATFGPPRYWEDPYGVCWWAGLVKVGVTTASTHMFAIPTSIVQPDAHHETLAGSGATFSAVRFSGSVTAAAAGATGGIGWVDYLAGPATNGWLSLAGLTTLTPRAATKLQLIDLSASNMLLNSWVPYGAAGSGNQVPTLTKRPDGLNMTYGLAKSGTIASPMFYMPERYTPRGQLLQQNVSNQAKGRTDASGMFNSSTAFWRAFIPQQGSNVWYAIDNFKWYSGGM